VQVVALWMLLGLLLPGWLLPGRRLLPTETAELHWKCTGELLLWRW